MSEDYKEEGGSAPSSWLLAHSEKICPHCEVCWLFEGSPGEATSYVAATEDGRSKGLY